MIRQDGWEQRLEELVQANRNTPFAWGAFDCTRFVHTALLAIYGESPFDKYDQEHASEEQAYEYLKTLNLKSAWGLVGRHAKKVEPAFAQRGNIIGHVSGNGQSLGVCLGSIFAAPSDDGLVFLSMSEAKKAWSLDG